MICIKKVLVGSFSTTLNERTNSLLTFLNVGSITKSKLLFLGCVVMSDLHLLQYNVLLNPCFKCSKDFMFLFLDKVTTGTKSLTLFIWNAASVVDVADSVWVGGLVAISGVLYISDIMQFFDHDKSSSILVNQRQIEKSPKVNQII